MVYSKVKQNNHLTTKCNIKHIHCNNHLTYRFLILLLVKDDMIACIAIKETIIANKFNSNIVNGTHAKDKESDKNLSHVVSNG